MELGLVGLGRMGAGMIRLPFPDRHRGRPSSYDR